MCCYTSGFVESGRQTCLTGYFSMFFSLFLACSAKFATGLYILASIISFFLLSKLSQDVLDRFSRFFTARRYVKCGISRRHESVCLSVCMSHSGIVSKQPNVGSHK